MKKDTKLSVIIPAHNCAATLVKAVESVPNNTFVETLIIENGSTDATLKIAQDIAEGRLNTRVLVSQPGVSMARNLGISSSRGSKILFLDADDFFLPAIYEVSKMLPDNDLSIFSYESGSVNQKLFNRDTIYQGNELSSLIGQMLDYPTTFLTVWGKIFDTQIIKKNKLSFMTDLRLSEDSLFLIQYLSFCSRVGCYREYLYHYSRNEDSTVRSFNKNSVRNYLKSLAEVKKFIQAEAVTLPKHYYKYGLMQLNLIGVHGIFDPHNPISFLRKVRLLKQTVQNPIIMECLKETKIKDLDSIKFIAIVLIKLHLYSGAGIIFTLRNHHG